MNICCLPRDLQAALYFGLEGLVFKCRTWFSDIIMMERLSSQLELDEMIHFWEFGLEHGRTSTVPLEIS